MEITSLSESQFNALQPSWDALLDQSTSQNVFLTWTWMHTWWTVYKPQADLYLLAVHQNEVLIGLAPFYRPQTTWPRPQVLKLCSSDDVSPDHLDLIAAPGQEDAVALAVVDHLKSHRQEWDVLDFDNLSADSRFLAHAATFGHFWQRAVVSQHCPYIQIRGTFKDYFSQTTLGRFSLEKKWSKLTSQENGKQVRVQDESGLSAALDYLFSLHAKRAAMKNMRSDFATTAMEKFHRQVAASFLRQGVLDLQLITVRDMPISAFYAFRYKKKAAIYQTGFDPEWKKFSVGGLLFFLALQNAFEEGLGELDFLKGTESYKEMWADGLRDEMRLMVYNKSSRGLAAALISSTRTALRALKSKILTKPTPISPS